MPLEVRNNIGQVRTKDLQSKLGETQALSNYLNMVIAQRNANAGEKDLSPILNTIKANLDQERETLQQQISATRQIVSAQEQEIGAKEAEIATREQVLRAKDQAVDDHRELLNVRDRMLQLSQEKNIYKQKVIYTLIALIIGVFLVMIVGYVYFGGSPAQ